MAYLSGGAGYEDVTNTLDSVWLVATDYAELVALAAAAGV
jgi:hypothetical protein